MQSNNVKKLMNILGFDPNYSYSSMRKGGLDQRVMYNGVEFIWGLNEKGLPPTLIYPRPNIVIKSREGDITRTYYETRDFVMHRCIENEKPEDIVAACLDKTIVFKYGK